jgi:hypothetical protein
MNFDPVPDKRVKRISGPASRRTSVAGQIVDGDRKCKRKQQGNNPDAFQQGLHLGSLVRLNTRSCRMSFGVRRPARSGSSGTFDVRQVDGTPQ